MEVDRLELAIQAEATKASAELDKLVSKLNIVSTALKSINAGSFKSMSNELNEFGNAVKGLSNVKTSDFNRLEKNINKMASLNHGGLRDTSSAINEIGIAFNNIGTISDDSLKISELAKNISKLGNNNVLKAADNLPKLSIALKDFMTTLSTAPNVSQNIISMTNAMANLASTGAKYNSTINSVSKASTTLTKANNTATTSTNNLNNSQRRAQTSAFSLSMQLSKLAAIAFSIQRAFNFVGNSIEKSMDFTETVNLFQTSFKKIGMETAQGMGMEWGSETADQFAIGFIDRAQSFNDKLTDALSLDPNMLMNSQAIFAQMSNSMGLVSDTAMNISESFSMLGNDIASLWNIDTEKAMQKLQSGLAGQIRPLRELGVDISQTSLEMYALKYGIEDNISSMSQAAKVQLRWLAIMDQTEVAFGDMAKTIDSPSNQLRILSQQWSNLSRSIGNVFMPIVSTVLPYINALVIALRRMIDTFATAVGFELPNYSNSDIYTDITGGIDGIEDSANDATKATNKLKKALLGIDELNILSEGASSKKKTDSTGSGYGELDNAISDKTNSYMAKFNEELAKMSSKAEELADKIQPKIEALVEWIEKLSPAFAGVAAAFATYKIVTWFTDLAKGIGALSLSPAGVVALAIGALAAIVVAIHKYYDKLVEKDLSERFGDIVLSMEDIEEIAERLTKSDYSANIDIFVTENAKLSEIEKNIEKDIEKLNKYNWKVSVGIGLTPSEQEDYKSTIESFVKNSQDYITQKQYVVNLALTATITEDKNFLKEMQKLVNEYYDGSRSEMETLGKKLRTAMDEALADGILDEEEQKVITNLQNEINEITKRIADAEFKAKLQMLSVEYGDVDITAESFKKITDKAQELTKERLGDLEEANYSVLASVNASYKVKMDNATTEAERKKIQDEWDADVKKYTNEFSKTKSTITLEGVTFSIDALSKKYETEIEKTGPIVQQSIKDAIEDGMYWGFQDISQDTDGALEDAYSLPLERLTSDIAKYYEKNLSKELPTATRKSAKEMFETLTPTVDELKTIYDGALEAGDQVPEGVSDALTAISNIGMLAGDMDSINFLLGQKLSTDKTFLDLLATSETAGATLDKSLIAGLKSKIPDLEKQGDKLIFDTDKAIQKATKDSGKNNMPGYAGNIASGLAKGFNDDKTVNKSLTDLLDGVNRTISNWKVPDLKVAFNVTTSAIDEALKGYGMYGFNMPNPYSNVKGYATGGFPTPGELFVANEPGNPELIGNIGGRTAVVNPTQIVESVSGGVANAVADVLVPALMGMMGGNNSNVMVESNLYVDSEKMYSISQKGKAKSQRRYQTAEQY